MGGSTFDFGSNSTPFIADWNNDGRKDVLCGEQNGRVFLLINEGTDAAPLFNSPAYIQNGSVYMDVGSSSSPALVDWNRDGRKDLLVGEMGGRVFYFENKGTDADPAFNGFLYVIAGGMILDVDSYSRIETTDWDGDGVADLVSGANISYGPPHPGGGVSFFRALGPLSVDENALSAAAGGLVHFALDAGPAMGNRSYFMFGNVTGTEPGFPLPGGLVTLPLNWDVFTALVFRLANSPALPGFQGTLTAYGTAAAELNTFGPLPPTGVGLVMRFAYLLYAPYDFVSNPAAVEIVP